MTLAVAYRIYDRVCLRDGSGGSGRSGDPKCRKCKGDGAYLVVQESGRAYARCVCMDRVDEAFDIVDRDQRGGM